MSCFLSTGEFAISGKTYPDQLEYKVFQTSHRTETPAKLLFLCHGFGAPGGDLIPVAEQVIEALESENTEQNVRIVVPAAPLRLDEIPGYEARAWWMLNMQALEQAIGTGNLDALCKSVPPGLDQARELLLKLIQQQTTELGLPLSHIVLGGFSQGAMLSTDVALHLPEKVGGLAILSGTLVCENEWTELAKSKAGLKVMQTHGDTDPILPIQAARRLNELLTNAGANTKFVSFHGPHTIPMGTAELIAAMIGEIK